MRTICRAVSDMCRAVQLAVRQRPGTVAGSSRCPYLCPILQLAVAGAWRAGTTPGTMAGSVNCTTVSGCRAGEANSVVGAQSRKARAGLHHRPAHTLNFLLTPCLLVLPVVVQPLPVLPSAATCLPVLPLAAAGAVVVVAVRLRPEVIPGPGHTAGSEPGPGSGSGSGSGLDLDLHASHRGEQWCVCQPGGGPAWCWGGGF